MQEQRLGRLAGHGALITGALLIPVLGMTPVLAVMTALNALMALALFVRVRDLDTG